MASHSKAQSTMIRSLLCAALIQVMNSTVAQDCTVLSYNIRYDNPNDGPDRWELRKEALAMEVLSHTPSIIGLQEALVHQLAFLDQRFAGYARFGVGRDDGKTRGEFCPIYFDSTRFHLLSGRTIWLSPTPDAPSKGWDAVCERIATLVILHDTATGDSLWVVNTHWDHEGAEARRHSARIVCDLLEPALSRGKYVILMGDLNATPVDEAIAVLGSSVLDSCPHQRSGNGTFNGFALDPDAFKRIDYVWLSPGNWEVSGYAVPHPLVNGRQVSDHFPVVVSLARK